MSSDAAASAPHALDAAGASGSAISHASSSTTVVAPRRPLKVFYQPVHERNIHNVKLLIATVLPVAYQESFFKNLLTVPEEFCKLGSCPFLFASPRATERHHTAGRLQRPTRTPVSSGAAAHLPLCRLYNATRARSLF